MNGLMEFIEQYWGVTLVGGVSVGGIITFAVVQIKYLIRERTKNVTINTLMDAVTNTIAKKDADAMKWAEEKSALLAQNEYYQATQAVMFKSISYLVAASKLPIEEKLKLQEDFVNLKNMTVEQLKPVATDIVNEVKEEAKEQAPIVTTIINDAVETATSLLDKYTKKEGA